MKSQSEQMGHIMVSDVANRNEFLKKASKDSMETLAERCRNDAPVRWQMNWVEEYPGDGTIQYIA